MITLGCDPEAFIRGSFTEKAVPAPLAGGMKGSKHEPCPVPFGAILIDGMAVEFNIDPVASKADWLRNIRSVLASLMNHLPGYMLDFSPVCSFSNDLLDQVSDEHFILGCDVDYNAWTGEPNPRPELPRSLRTSAGHIHIGIEKDLSPSQKEGLVKHLDMCLFNPSRAWDGANQARQKFYGKPGCYRPKPYGLEYRVLSSLWLETDILAGYIFDQTMWAVETFLDGTSYAGEFHKFTELPPANSIRFLEARGAPACPMSVQKYAA